MLEIGQTFNKNGYELCLIELLLLNNSQYALFSVENINDKSIPLTYKFYLVNYINGDYKLDEVVDEKLLFQLYEIIEKKED